MKLKDASKLTTVSGNTLTNRFIPTTQKQNKNKDFEKKKKIQIDTKQNIQYIVLLKNE